MTLVPMVVMMVPQKKKALARFHLLVKFKVLLASTPASIASITRCREKDSVVTLLVAVVVIADLLTSD